MAFADVFRKGETSDDLRERAYTSVEEAPDDEHDPAEDGDDSYHREPDDRPTP